MGRSRLAIEPGYKAGLVTSLYRPLVADTRAKAVLPIMLAKIPKKSLHNW